MIRDIRFYCNFVSVCRGVCGCVRGRVKGASRVYHGFLIMCIFIYCSLSKGFRKEPGSVKTN